MNLKNKDITRYFDNTQRNGVLIQYKLKRAIYFVNNICIDEFPFDEDTTINDLENWIKAKNNHFKTTQITFK